MPDQRPHASEGSQNVPFMSDDLLEAVEHAIVGVSAGALASLQLSCQKSAHARTNEFEVAMDRRSSAHGRIAHTRVFTTSSGYLRSSTAGLAL